MAGLGDFIEGFLAADGYVITERTERMLVAERRRGDALARRKIWYADPVQGLRADEATLLSAFKAQQSIDGKSETAFFVTPTLDGLSTGFRKSASDHGVGVRVPVQFFDTPYKTDGDEAFGSGRGGEARSVAADFIREHKDVLAARIAQPFVALSALGAQSGGFAAGPDLLAHLAAELMEPPDAPRITLVIGNAGAGKSHLFAALFEAVHRHFTAEKRALRLASRPLLFLPAHIRDTRPRSLDSLLEAVAATDTAAPTGPALMRWLNTNGLTTWMFDGLDEFFAGEADFLAALEASLVPESRARAVICVRDSLLTSSTALRALVDRHVNRGAARIYELSRWERPSQRALAWRRLTGQRLDDAASADPPVVARFLAALDGSAALGDLATLPYYCDLLLALQQDTRSGRIAPADEFALLSLAVDGLIDREAGKLGQGDRGFDWDVFSGADAFVDATDMVAAFGTEPYNAATERSRLLAALNAIGRDRLVELIEAIAHRMRMLEPYPNESKGLATADLAQLAEFYLDVGLASDLEPRVLLAVVQFAFFGPSRETGFVRFAHEIIADFLAARYALRQIRTAPESADALGQALGIRRDLDRSIFFRYLVHELRREPDIAATIAAHVGAGRVRKAHAENAALLAAALGPART